MLQKLHLADMMKLVLKFNNFKVICNIIHTVDIEDDRSKKNRRSRI